MFANENPGKEASYAAGGFWVKIVEAEPIERDLKQGLLEWFRVGFGISSASGSVGI